MITAAEFLAPARAAGLDFFTGVPCSYLTPLINGVASADVGYLSAANEGEAIALAAGAWLAGRRPVVMMQNSGLGNALSPITSLLAPFAIPLLLVITWRGRPGEVDEPQHALMGPITPALLDLVGLPHRQFPTDVAAVAPAIQHATDGFLQRRARALILERGAVRAEPLVEPMRPPAAAGVVLDRRTRAAPPRRAELLAEVLRGVPATTAIISTTGVTSRELFTLGDRPAHFYMVGSMGCAGAIGLGVASVSSRPVIVVDGDGAALMRLETLATIAARAPQRLVHVILDNGVHDSTGGQATAAPGVDFAAAAAALGYPRAVRVDSVAGFALALAAALAEPGPHLVHARIAPGVMPELGRPTIAPADVAARFRDFLA